VVHALSGFRGLLKLLVIRDHRISADQIGQADCSYHVWKVTRIDRTACCSQIRRARSKLAGGSALSRKKVVAVYLEGWAQVLEWQPGERARPFAPAKIVAENSQSQEWKNIFSLT